MFKKLLQIIVDPKEPAKEAPEGLCPNCWGDQEYGKVIRDVYKDKQIDVNNHSANQAFIQDFVTSHLDGIKLKKSGSGFECSTCRLRA